MVPEWNYMYFIFMQIDYIQDCRQGLLLKIA